MKHEFLMLAAMLGSVQLIHAQFTFGPAVSTTQSASITNYAGAGTFQYTDAANSTRDEAYLPLIGAAATYITTTNGWTASLTPSLAAKYMTSNGTLSPRDGIGLAVYSTSPNKYLTFLFLAQVNNTGGTTHDYPDYFYGTVAKLIAQTNGDNDVTSPLGGSVVVQGGSILELFAGTSGAAATESIGAVTGVLTLSYSAATNTLTGYYNGTPVGSYSLASWGANPPLTLLVCGNSGEGLLVPAGTDTAANFSAQLLPQLTLLRAGSNVVLSWATNLTGYTLQSTTNLNSPVVWGAVSPSPVVINGQNAVTNGISGTRKFYQLSP